MDAETVSIAFRKYRHLPKAGSLLAHFPARISNGVGKDALVTRVAFDPKVNEYQLAKAAPAR